MYMYLGVLPSASIFNCGTILPSSSFFPTYTDRSSELGKSNYKCVIYITITHTFLYLFVNMTV